MSVQTAGEIITLAGRDPADRAAAAGSHSALLFSFCCTFSLNKLSCGAEAARAGQLGAVYMCCLYTHTRQ